MVYSSRGVVYYVRVAYYNTSSTVRGMFHDGNRHPIYLAAEARKANDLRSLMWYTSRALALEKCRVRQAVTEGRNHIRQKSIAAAVKKKNEKKKGTFPR